MKMQLKIIKDEEKILLERREVRFEVTHKGASTPKKIEVAELLAAKLNAKLDLMLIEHFNTKFGRNISDGLCLVYNNEKAMKIMKNDKVLKPKKRIGEKVETQDSKEK